jgi:hypothetical protein
MDVLHPSALVQAAMLEAGSSLHRLQKNDMNIMNTTKF